MGLAWRFPGLALRVGASQPTLNLELGPVRVEQQGGAASAHGQAANSKSIAQGWDGDPGADVEWNRWSAPAASIRLCRPCQCPGSFWGLERCWLDVVQCLHTRRPCHCSIAPRSAIDSLRLPAVAGHLPCWQGAYCRCSGAQVLPVPSLSSTRLHWRSGDQHQTAHLTSSLESAQISPGEQPYSGHILASQNRPTPVHLINYIDSFSRSLCVSPPSRLSCGFLARLVYFYSRSSIPTSYRAPFASPAFVGTATVDRSHLFSRPPTQHQHNTAKVEIFNQTIPQLLS